MSIRSLETCRALYALPHDDLVGEVLVPAFRGAQSIDCMMGFFSSSAFPNLAPGLAAFLNRQAGNLRLLVSPVISELDQAAMQESLEHPGSVLARAASRLFVEADLSEDALIRHQYDCLAYMLASGRLEIRFAWVANGIFHPKVWLFEDGVDHAVAHGSSNLTNKGLMGNFETVTLERAWRGSEQAERCEAFRRMFAQLWEGRAKETVVVSLPDAVREQLLKRAAVSEVPTLDEFLRLHRREGLGRTARAGVSPPGRHTARDRPRQSQRGRADA